jgi:hypothetical protein
MGQFSEVLGGSLNQSVLGFLYWDVLPTSEQKSFRSNKNYRALNAQDIKLGLETSPKMTGISTLQYKILKGKAKVNMNFSVYGEWCGPGNPQDNENPKPVDELDEACMVHDICYKNQGYDNCNCDISFINNILREIYFWGNIQKYWGIEFVETFSSRRACIFN